VREFRDSRGTAWRAWSVTPGIARPGADAKRYLGEFHKGWICFEALDSSSRRRFPCQRSTWAGLKESDLEQMLDKAITAPERKRSQLFSTPPDAHTTAH
jgi:hypothetical protein